MATKFTFPRNPKIGDRIEVVSTSNNKLPINLVGNVESGKNLVLIFPDQTYSGVADGETVIATITAQNIIYGFRCVSIASTHVWLLEGTCLYSQIQALAQRVSTVEQSVQSLTPRVTALETQLATAEQSIQSLAQRVTALEPQPENQPAEGEGE